MDCNYDLSLDKSGAKIGEFHKDLLRGWPSEVPLSGPGVVAVSGGPDSVALLRLLHCANQGRTAGWTVAHFDHGLRTGSAEDAQFVGNLATALNWPFRLGHREQTGTSNQKGASDQFSGAVRASQESSRKARYRFLANLAESLAVSWVVTAHTADDQAETILHNLIRGTGLRGLGGMRVTRPMEAGVTLVRPLLCVHRTELLEFLDSCSQEYRLDPSNRDRAYTRVRVRECLLPLLAAEFNPRIVPALLRLGKVAEEAQREIDSTVRQAYAACVSCVVPNRIEVELDGCAKLSAFCIRELLVLAWRQARFPEQGMSFADWRSLTAMVQQSHPRRVSLPGGLEAQVQGTQLVIQRIETPKTPKT